MAFLKYNKAKIIGMSACVPKKIMSTSDLSNVIPKEEIDKTIKNIGIKERRYADKNTTAADLCYTAADKLLNDLNIDRDSIDILIFFSQTSDYKIPATAPILQDRLGLSIDTACFDMSLACSGYVYALSTAYSYISQPGINRVLLLDGETFSKIVSPLDKVNVPLYGDAGTATLIEKSEDEIMANFSLHTDGSGYEAVIIPSGGARNPMTKQSLEPTERENGNVRSDVQIYMEGVDVFNFTMKRVPKSIKQILKTSSLSSEDIDYVIFHQANKFMTNFFVKKLKLQKEKVPYCLDRFGNTSSASIPLTIVSELKGKISNKRILISGFGAGLSWGNAIIDFKDCHISELLEI